MWLLRFKANISEQMEHLILGIYWIGFMAAICLARDDSISLSRFVYGCIILFFWCPYLARRKDVSGYTTIGHYNQPQFCGDECLTFMFSVSVLAQVIWGISTNQGISIPGNVAYYAVLAVIMVVYDENYSLKLLEYGILLASIVFSCFWVMEDNGGFHHVMEQRYISPEGAYKGVALSATDYTMTQTCYSILSENVSEDDYLLVAFGAYSNGYLDSDAHQAAGSAYTRTHINDKLLQYWQLNPENQADYVLIDTNCGRYEKYVDSVCAQYINENYTREIANQNGIILLGR